MNFKRLAANWRQECANEAKYIFIVLIFMVLLPLWCWYSEEYCLGAAYAAWEDAIANPGIVSKLGLIWMGLKLGRFDPPSPHLG